jgi:anthranilate phosphoribosyltransferase
MHTFLDLPNPASPLDEDAAAHAFANILDGNVADEHVAAFLLALSLRDETAIEIAAAAKALRDRMIVVAAPKDAIDVCGTGGDGAHSLNISTAVAIVVATCGVPVAKHGNRAASSKAGAADTLEALGLDLERAAHTAEESLDKIGIAFLFAQRYHPALARLAPIRKSLGRRTIFNLTGPLANPAGVKRQLVGVARVDYLATVAEAMRLLGTDAALVVSGEESLDELSIAGQSRAVSVGACFFPNHIIPEDAGVQRHGLDSIRGGDPHYNAAALRALLDGRQGPYRDAVLLNAGAALVVGDQSATLLDGARLAGQAIDDGSARDLLSRWIAF